MSETSALHKFVHARLREVFGPPDNTLGRDDHWSIKPSASQAAINVLVNGTAEHPAVWVFDPHVPNDGVLRTAIQREEQIESVIEQILDRTKKAAERRN
jgi:hypothetical protein